MGMKPPQLSFHEASGQWFVKWAGKNHYLGKNRAAAEERYLTDPVIGLPAWTAWRADRNTKKYPPLKSMRRSVADVAEEFLDRKALEGGRSRRYGYAKHLKRFLYSFGAAAIDDIQPRHLESLKEHMLRGKLAGKRYSEKTINHDLSAIKSLLIYAERMDYRPPFPTKAVQPLPIAEPRDMSYTPEEVGRILLKAPNRMRPWLAICYFCLCRPSEVVRLVHRQGTWEEEGIFRCAGKMSWRTSRDRRVVVSRHAQYWLDQAERRWSRLDTFSEAVRETFGKGMGPKRLQKSAAKHLHLAGVARADIDLLLGHLPPRVSQIYNPIAWQHLRASANLLGVQAVRNVPGD